MRMRLLCLAPYPRTAASTRFRISQFVPYLERHGIACTVSPFLSEAGFARLYDRRSPFRAAAALLAATLRRASSIPSARDFDLVLVQRGSTLIGPPLVEWAIARVLRRPLVFDFDDAIWLSDPSSTWGAWTGVLKSPAKTAKIVKLARHVVVCNQYTRMYALKYRDPSDVTVIPTVVDETAFRPPAVKMGERPVIGWIGTHSTASYLELLRDPLETLARKRRFLFRVVGAGREIAFDGVQVDNKRWRLEDEVADYQSLDIGLYPVPDDRWGWGKTGFKPVVYMSTGSACVASPVGGVTEFLRHGENGLFARTAAEWVDALDALIADPGYRQRLAAEGRRTVEEGYCLSAQAPRLVEVLRACL